MDASVADAEVYRYDEDYLSRLTSGWTRVSFPIIARLVGRTLETLRPQRILDFGAGSGTYAQTLSARGAETDACDASPTCVAACEGSYARAFLLGDARELPSETYDLVFSSEVLEHIREYADTLGHLHRTLRPGGAVLLTTTAYAPSVFTMLYGAKNSGVGTAAIVREVARWAAGFWSAARRDAFIKRWCFEPLGGHYHGFLKRELLGAFRDAGFTIADSGGFFALEPLQLPFLHSHTFSGLARRKDWSVGKRVAAMAIYAVARPLNGLLKATGLGANNIFVVAVKDEHTARTTTASEREPAGASPLAP